MSFVMFSYLPDVRPSDELNNVCDVLHTLSLRVEIIFTVSSSPSVSIMTQFTRDVLDIWQLRFFDVFTVCVSNYPFFAMLFRQVNDGL